MTTPAQPASTRPTGGLTVSQAQEAVLSLLSDEETPAADVSKSAPAKKPEPKEPAKSAEPEPEPELDPEQEEPAAEEADPEIDPDADLTEPEPEPAPAPRSRKLKVDGEERVVTEDEAYASYQKDGYHTRRMQEVAKREKEFVAQATAVQTEREKYAVLLTRLESELSESMPQNVDWEALRRNDPEAFAVQFADYQYREGQRQRVAAERYAVEQKLETVRLETKNRTIAAEREKLLEAVPEWKDEGKFKAGQTALLDYGRSLGFTDEDLLQVDDHRALVVLDKARRYDALVRRQATQKADIQKKIEKAAVTARPGTPGAGKTRETSDLTRQKQRLAKTGSREDGVRTVRMLLDAEEAA